MNWTERLSKHKTCPFYEEGDCCRACYMGPCRITDKVKEGVCGATGPTISARNLGRMAAAGASSLSTAALSILGSQHRDWFSSQEEKGMDLSKILPAERVALLNRLHLTPRNVQREIVELLHRVSIGVDQECEHILFQTIRTSLGGVLSSALLQSDEKPEKEDIDTSILSEEKPNVILWGNVQLSSDKVQVYKVDSILALEALIASGMVDVILSEQLSPSIRYTASCYHTRCIHSEEEDVVKKAVDAKEKRAQTLRFKGKISKPKLSGQILKNALLSANIRGIVWLSGCPNPVLEDTKKEVIKELVANNILVLLTGCSVSSILETGLLDKPIFPTGEFLKGFCEKENLPPAVYLGGCLREGEVIRLFNEMAGDKDLASLPIVLCFPSWRSERNISLMLGAIACGISVQVTSSLPIVPEVRGFLDSGCNEMLLAHLLKDDASVLEYINRKREKLGLAGQLSLYEPKVSTEDYTNKVAAAGFSVYRELGGGLSPEVYKKALNIELKDRGINIGMVKVAISYLNEVVFESEELLVENELIVCVGIDNSVQKLVRTSLIGAKKEKGLWFVFDTEMLRIGCVDLAKRKLEEVLKNG
ncbi:GxxExxY protein [bacterium]|nr:GxxExxY protein [bacterium]